jgi:L-ascorbate metabolism protein UlaG (beta-lactamase superfamily)
MLAMAMLERYPSSMSEANLLEPGRRERRIEASPRFKNGRFRNTHPTKMMREPFDSSMALDFLAGRAARSPRSPLPIFEHALRALSSPPKGGLRVTWLGHSTVLVEIDGVRLLTDPVWGERVSPVSFAGPKRFHPPPIALADLPPIDAVVLSHDHYDHLDASTVKSLARGAAPGFSGRFITALGVGAHLERLGVRPESIVELDWGEGEKVGSVDVVATPAQHFSGRGAFDRNRTLWAGMALLGPRHRVFFSGDTGPTDEHADIGASLGPFDVALFEIGAWHPAWGDIHLGPGAAFESFGRVRARALLPVHWSTFDLGLHPWEEPAEELFRIASDTGAPLWTPLLGQPTEPASALMQPWWRDVLSLSR